VRAYCTNYLYGKENFRRRVLAIVLGIISETDEKGEMIRRSTKRVCVIGLNRKKLYIHTHTYLEVCVFTSVLSSAWTTYEQIAAADDVTTSTRENGALHEPVQWSAVYVSTRVFVCVCTRAHNVYVCAYAQHVFYHVSSDVKSLAWHTILITVQFLSSVIYKLAPLVLITLYTRASPSWCRPYYYRFTTLGALVVDNVPKSTRP